ncbi:hypothetical protein [Turneriella parva]|uniref:Restriction endonuclease type IV Mrr domain-containing protein n=1 Tax=Turneriella parva (strain ATCC BAA-1111 / DSM 21527 / NCTC 11395 / H) TaxID=869212 RepID=I4B9K9_TURPD|nr:hypothetical protein [Turneriella parva]AFM13966.1 hypothetical protein Turpa_3328 [Turneriella parva DSM 21527]
MNNSPKPRKFPTLSITDINSTVADERDIYFNIADFVTWAQGDFPENCSCDFHDESGFDTYLFHELNISRGLAEELRFEFICQYPNKYWEGKWGLSTYLSTFADQVGFSPRFELGELDLEDDWKKLTVIAEYKFPGKIEEALGDLVDELKRLEQQTQIALSGLSWLPEFEKNERRFCTDLLHPLLRRMGFLSVRYRQGAMEYGKDFTFSELTQFGEFRHFGLQAKAGNVSGEVNSQIDELIGQIDDAFSMPYTELGSKDDRYISVFIIAISGAFTHNAKEKIAQKISKTRYGSVLFLDRDKILELIEKYWIKHEGRTGG